MAEPRETEARRFHGWFGRGRTRGLLTVIGLLLAPAAMSTWAYWSTTETVNAGTLSAGSLDLQLDADLAGAGGTTTRAWSATDLIPGQYRSFNTTVRNTGDVGFSYRLDVAAGSTWAYTNGAVSVLVHSGTANADGTCSGGSIGSTTLTIPAAAPLFTARTLNRGAAEEICLRVGLVDGAPSENQGRSGTLRFTFTATQVAA